MQRERRIKIVLEYFEEFKQGMIRRLGLDGTSGDLAFADCYESSTEFGQFIPSDIEDVNAIFALLEERGLDWKGKKFLDAGCGDARVCALASVYDAEVTGIEGCALVHKKAISRLMEIRQRGIEIYPEIILGNFLHDDTYQTPFSEFDVVYNFINSEEQLAEKFAEEAKDDAIFILYGGSGRSFDGLVTIETVHTCAGKVCGRSPMPTTFYRKTV